MNNKLPNPTSIDTKVGELIEIKSIPISLVGETSMLEPAFEHLEEGLKFIRSKRTEESAEGGFVQLSYNFQALSEGQYSIEVYFRNRVTKQKWIPSENSYFKDNYKQIIQVNITE